jgi:hypothetical protein
MFEYVTEILFSAWVILGQMAPYLLFGFLAAGVLSVLVSPEWVERHLGGHGLRPVVKSTIFGIPLPLCSCGVIPVTASIRQHGAGPGATTAFLLSTPQTGVDSLLATYALLGPIYMVFRFIAALVTGIVGGLLVAASTLRGVSPDTTAEVPDDSCSDECCGTDKNTNRVVQALRYGLVTLPRDIAVPLLVGIAIAGLIGAFVEEGYLSAYLGGGFLAMLAMMAVGIPIYVCSTASIPIAVGFIHMGASPGAALVFLIVGPATNAAAISVIWKILGRRSTLIYLGTVAVAAMAAGYALDFVYWYWIGVVEPLGMVHEEHGIGWFTHLSAIVLVGVCVASLLAGKWKSWTGDGQAVDQPEGDQDMDRITLDVEGMSCSHCANTVSRTLRELPGVQSAEVDLSNGKAVVTGPDLAGDRLVEAVDQIGYRAKMNGE